MIFGRRRTGAAGAVVVRARVAASADTDGGTVGEGSTVIQTSLAGRG